VTVPLEVALAAREMRTRRRTRSGSRWRPWPQIADEIARLGLGRFDPVDLGHAVARLPIEAHPAAPPPAAELARVTESFRRGWAEEFPGVAWPGLEEARRQLRARALP